MKITAIIALCALALTCNAKTLQGKVVKVADGDTVTVLDAAKTQHRIRLNRIDAPEKKQAFGEASRKHLAGFIAGKDVRIEWEKKDQYGRILGIIYNGETDINLQMVKDGFAWHYKHFDKTPSYAEAEKTAREKKLGLWSDPNPVEPYLFRKANKK